jgi:hypothetical protein
MLGKSNPAFRKEEISQKTVPSLKIAMGGHWVLGREISAISRPPYYLVSKFYFAG